jgi:hypothetical protein
MCCCHPGRGHSSQRLHAGRSCGCGSHGEPCDKTGHAEARTLHRAVQDLQARVQAVEEQLAAEHEA